MDNYGNQGEAPGQRERLIRQYPEHTERSTLLPHNHKHPLYY